MESTGQWPRVQEPIARVLRRNGAIAVVVGFVVALRRHEPALVLAFSILALWFSLGGHYVELFFLDVARPRLPRTALAQRTARVAVWFVGGSILYVLMAATARMLPVPSPRFEFWWSGGLLLIGIELLVHALLSLRGAPNFYRSDA